LFFQGIPKGKGFHACSSSAVFEFPANLMCLRCVRSEQALRCDLHACSTSCTLNIHTRTWAAQSARYRSNIPALGFTAPV